MNFTEKFSNSVISQNIIKVSLECPNNDPMQNETVY